MLALSFSERTGLRGRHRSLGCCAQRCQWRRLLHDEDRSAESADTATMQILGWFHTSVICPFFDEHDIARRQYSNALFQGNGDRIGSAGHISRP